MIRGREDLAFAERIVIKAGTSVVSTPEGYPCLSRLSHIVEQVLALQMFTLMWFSHFCSLFDFHGDQASALVKRGKQVLIVTSGAVGVGRQIMRKQAALSTSMRHMVHGNGAVPVGHGRKGYDSACAAAGQVNYAPKLILWRYLANRDDHFLHHPQLGLMSLYETLFSQYDVATSQLLVTGFDFESPERRRNLQVKLQPCLPLSFYNAPEMRLCASPLLAAPFPLAVCDEHAFIARHCSAH